MLSSCGCLLLCNMLNIRMEVNHKLVLNLGRLLGLVIILISIMMGPRIMYLLMNLLLNLWALLSNIRLGRRKEIGKRRRRNENIGQIRTVNLMKKLLLLRNKKKKMRKWTEGTWRNWSKTCRKLWVSIVLKKRRALFVLILY